MSKFYFYQLACHYKGWFDEYGVIEVTPDYAIMNSSHTIHYEVYDSLSELKKALGKDFIRLTRLK